MESIESAAFSAWPALDSQDLYGWHLRFADGYTKRANSANCTQDSEELSESQVDHIKQIYQNRGLQPIFRLTSISAPPQIDSLLAEKRYRFVDMSLVMTTSLDIQRQAELPTCAASPESWLNIFQQVSGKLEASQAIHLKMLQSIKSPCAFAIKKSQDGVPTSCGLGVLEQGQLGLFDVATSPDYRRRGLARELCGELLQWGSKMEAKVAFVQVVAANSSAISLYESLGFRYAYHYWYRIGD